MRLFAPITTDADLTAQGPVRERHIPRLGRTVTSSNPCKARHRGVDAARP